MKRLVACVSLASAVILPIITPVAVEAQSSSVVSGEILVLDVYYGFPGEPCNQNRRGYQDIMHGFSIPVRDGGDDIIAVIDVPPGVNEDSGGETDSVESFVFCNVSIPETQLPYSDFYVFDLGRRGEITKSYQQMQEDSWQLILTVGGRR